MWFKYLFWVVLVVYDFDFYFQVIFGSYMVVQFMDSFCDVGRCCIILLVVCCQKDFCLGLYDDVGNVLIYVGYVIFFQYLIDFLDW